MFKGSGNRRSQQDQHVHSMPLIEAAALLATFDE